MRWDSLLIFNGDGRRPLMLLCPRWYFAEFIWIKSRKKMKQNKKTDVQLGWLDREKVSFWRWESYYSRAIYIGRWGVIFFFFMYIYRRAGLLTVDIKEMLKFKVVSGKAVVGRYPRLSFMATCLGFHGRYCRLCQFSSSYFHTVVFFFFFFLKTEPLFILFSLNWHADYSIVCIYIELLQQVVPLACGSWALPSFS